jgi:hypothetical protein
LAIGRNTDNYPKHSVRSFFRVIDLSHCGASLPHMADLSSRERLVRALDEADRVEIEIRDQDRKKDDQENDRLAKHLQRPD